MSTPSSRLRIVLADDHVVVRQGIKALLEHELEKDLVQVVGEASDGQAAIKLCETLQPEIAVLDVAMPVLNGIDASREILRRCPLVRVILLTVYPEDSYVLASLHAGVSGYVVKSNAASHLLDAIESVAKGEVYLSPSISRAVVNACLVNGGTPSDPLSVREREVLQLIAEGKSMRDIGDVLGISARTAETHRARIMDKLEIRDVPGLVRYAIRHRLIAVDADETFTLERGHRSNGDRAWNKRVMPS
jgi:two-component system, NarL family, response regulator NreC